jgi:tetratricopeptide (TPR) repeat protein
VLLPACAARQEPPPTPAGPSADELARQGDALVARGSYSTLLEAHEIRRSLHERAPEGVGSRDDLIEVSLLLALRQRQLAIPGDAYLEAAETLLAQRRQSPLLEAMAGAARSAASSSAGVMNDDLGARFGRVRAEDAEAWREVLSRAAIADPVAVPFHLELSARLRWGGLGAPPPDDQLAAHPQSPLVAIAAAIDGSEEQARRALELEPTMAEAHLIIGRASMRSDPVVAEQHLRTAFEGIPGSVSTALGLADVLFSLEDLSPALEQYERVLALAAEHRDAHLRKGILLNMLGRPRDSIETLQKLLELGNWHLGEGHYWLALGHRDLADDASAERHTELAKRYLRGDVRVLALSGSLALERDDLPRSRERYAEAVQAAEALPTQWAGDDALCESLDALGVIDSRLEAWAEGRVHFQRASGCHDDARGRVEMEIERVRGWQPGARRDARLAAKARVLERVLRQRAGSLYNAAVCAGRAGQLMAARDLARRAGRHDDYAEKAEALLLKLH